LSPQGTSPSAKTPLANESLPVIKNEEEYIAFMVMTPIIAPSRFRPGLFFMQQPVVRVGE
jgi:hypothetical protein